MVDQLCDTIQDIAQDTKRLAAPVAVPVALHEKVGAALSVPDLSNLQIAVLIPCYNEEASIASVVRDFSATLPAATIYVYDNNSKDLTAELARQAGAVVRNEPLQGKGNVVRRMFADIEADVYVLVDGDDTYHSPSAPILVSKLVSEQLDMVNGARVTEIAEAYRPGHRFGNMVLTGIVAKIFGNRVADMLSGYRVFSRRFVKSFPALSSGFEIETELTVHALELRMPMSDVETPYKDRPPGSASKLRTYYDGFRILKLILVLVKEERPLQFFSILSGVMAFIALVLAWPVLVTFVQTGLVPRLPTAVLSTSLMLLAFLSLACGLILETVTRGRREMKRMKYLSIPVPGAYRVYKARQENGRGMLPVYLDEVDPRSRTKPASMLSSSPLSMQKHGEQ